MTLRLLPGCTETKLFEMEESEHTFYLTGSRYFGTKTEGSDYDFFIQYDPEVVTWLMQRGFTHLQDSPEAMDEYEGDPNIALVFRWTPGYHGGPHIDVQMVTDLQRKQYAQYALYQLGVLSRPHTRAEAKKWWRAVYDLTFFSKDRI